MSDHTVMKHLTENLSSKSQSRWTSIRPHLSSGVDSASRGWEGANINHEPGNVGLKSPPDRVILGKQIMLQIGTCVQYDISCVNHCTDSNLNAREIHNSRISSLGKSKHSDFQSSAQHFDTYPPCRLSIFI